MRKVIIAGSRGFDSFKALKEYCDKILGKEEVIVISGTARGADKLGEKWAKDHGYKVVLYPADWNLYGKSAGYIRNKEMAEQADVLIAFWDRKSRGTKMMIDIAQSKGMEVYVYPD